MYRHFKARWPPPQAGLDSREQARPDHQRAIKAVHVLEQIGGDEARQLLESLAKGAPGAKLTVAAKSVLDRQKEASRQAATARPPRGAGRIPKDGLTSEELEALWKDLASEDAAKAYQAIKRLRAVPGQSVALLKERSHPEKPVAAQEITRLITALPWKCAGGCHLVHRVPAPLGSRQEQNLLLDIRSQIQQVEDLADACPAYLADLG